MKSGKTYGVIGLARAGVPAARFLAQRGARVLGYDNRPTEELTDGALALRESGVELHTGEHGYKGLEQCECIVLSPGLKLHHEPLKSIIGACEARGAEVIGELELASRHCPAPMITVTGTKGKSTTVKLITEMLQACGLDAIRAGNTGVPLIAELSNLSPDSWAVVEVSSFQLEKAPTFKPRIAVLLNLLADHQDYHPSLEQYWRTKLKMFANQSAEDTAILNVNDRQVFRLVLDQLPQLQGWLRQLKPRVLLSGVQEGGSLQRGAVHSTAIVRENVVSWSQGCRFEDQWLAILPVEQIPLRGEHNLANVAAAVAAVGAALGDAVEDFRPQLADAIRSFESLPHRLEIVGQVGGVTWVNDSQATIPDAAVRALASFPSPVTLITGGRTKLNHPGAFDLLGRAIAERAHRLITIGEAAPVITAAARRAGFPGARVLDAGTLDKAVQLAAADTPSGGTVILSPACASFDQFTSFEARGEAFRSAVQALETIRHESHDHR